MTESPRRRPPVRPGTADAILEAAIEILARDPSARIDDIVERSGVARATLFRRFPARRDLVRAAGIKSLRDVERLLETVDLTSGDPALRLLRICEVLVPAGLKLRFVYSFGDLFEDPALAQAADRLNRFFEPVIIDAIREGVVTHDFDVAWFTEVFDALLFASWTAIQKGTIAPARAPKMLVQTLLQGFGP